MEQIGREFAADQKCQLPCSVHDDSGTYQYRRFSCSRCDINRSTAGRGHPASLPHPSPQMLLRIRSCWLKGSLRGLQAAAKSSNNTEARRTMSWVAERVVVHCRCWNSHSPIWPPIWSGYFGEKHTGVRVKARSKGRRVLENMVKSILFLETHTSYKPPYS